MSKVLKNDELRKMNEKDLTREIGSQRLLVAKYHLSLEQGREKGSHHLRNAKKSLAQMETALTRLRHSENPSRIPASDASAADTSIPKTRRSVS